MSCSVFNKDFIEDINWNTINVDISFLKNLIDQSKAQANSGIWIPVYIDSNNNNSKYAEPLIQASPSYVEPFNPCSCSDSQIFSIGRTYYENNRDVDLNCDYCGSYSQEWRLYDDKGTSSEDVLGQDGIFTSDCCGGACDIKLKTDDFLPKIPVLNQTYISGFYDFKYLKEFPACSSPGLGKEFFIFFTGYNSIGNDAVFCIDWKLKETISEVEEYDAFSSQHINEYAHNKSAKKAGITSKTCGNFILLDFEKDITTEEQTTIEPEKYQDYLDAYPIFDTMGTYRSIPTPESFTKPYGFRDGTYNNIFVNKEKLTSYWKWDYTSGIIAWVRYNPKNVDIFGTNEEDTRPIKNYDIYISPGDVFFATNIGPEPENVSFINSPSTPDVSYGIEAGDTETSEQQEDYFIKPCPSGLKIVDSNNIVGIIPPKSRFIYISENIYSRFYDLYSKYINDYKTSHNTAVQLASTLCTAPLYDGFTTDLMDKEGFQYYSQYNEFGQISGLNKLMLQGTEYDSANNLNYISNIKELVLTLNDKYGGYVWVPPKSKKTINFPLSTPSASMYVDLTFDTVINEDIIKYRKSNALPYKNCPAGGVESLNALKLYYDQNFIFGNLHVSSKIENDFRSKQICENESVKNSDFTLYAGVSLNNNILNSIPIFSGAYSFLDIYRRIVDPDNILSYCGDCGEESSFYLAADSSDLCNNAEDDSKTFCYATESFRLNNSEGDTDGTRPLRNISNNTEYFYRGYPTIAFNPHIDLVAFHQNGGTFFNSAVFNEQVVFDKNVKNTQGNYVSINFETQDVGIKLYSISAAKLQSNEEGTEQCERFPIDFDKSCKCYGLNLNQYNQHPKKCNKKNTSYEFSSLYIPNFSTRYSPPLEYYGGFSNEEITNLFGIDPTELIYRLGNRKIYIPSVKEKIDPENPYGCEKSSSITLGNYTTSKYSLNLINYDSSNSDIIASVDEPIDLTGRPNNFEETDEGEEITTTNIYWKRFLNKVTINNVVLYKDQEKIITPKGSNLPINYNVQLVNPFLNAILNNSDASLPFPTADPCAAVNNNIIINNGVRGDETSYVNLTITQKPKKQLLTFSFGKRRNTDAADKMYLGSFHPNLGLFNEIRSDSGKAIDKEGNILYGINNTNFNNIGFGGILQEVLFGGINKKTIDSLEKISKFSINKKPKLYVKNEDKWKSVYNPSKKGYRLDNIDYIGNSMLFEYTLNNNSSLKIPGLIPAIPRRPFKLNYFYRIKSLQDEIKLVDQFPISRNKDYEVDLNNPKVMRFAGVREYFRAAEKLNIIGLFSSSDSRRSEVKDIQDFIKLFNLEEVYVNNQKGDSASFYMKIGYVVDVNIGYYVFSGGDFKEESNYIFIGKNPNINKFYSNLDIDYSNYSRTGYVYNTYKECQNSSAIFEYPNERERTTKTAVNILQITNEIISKKIVVKFYDKDGNPLINVNNFNQSDKYIKIYTELTFKNKIKAGFIGVDFFSSDSIIAYLNLDYLQQESDRLLSNDIYQTKWGDLIKYDGSLFYNPHIISYANNYGPSTPYKNLFFRQIFNEGNSNFSFGFQAEPNGPAKEIIQFAANEYRPYFNILQKYGINSDSIWSTDTMKYENYLPFLEINTEGSGYGKIPHTGYLSSNMFYIPYDSIEDLTVYDKQIKPNNIFFAKADYIESAFVPEDQFFNETLRLDTPLFWLNKTIRKNEYRSSTGSDAIKAIFVPNNVNTYVNTNENLLDDFKILDTITRESPYYRKPVYADLDASGSCIPEKCLISNLGNVSLYSEFKQAEPKIYNKLEEEYDDYFIGYDAGLYNPLGDSRYISIIRTELDLSNPVEEEITCNTRAPKPNVSQSLLSSYQDYILDKSSTHKQNLLKVVANPETADNLSIMDHHANEMLFRIFYGEKQKINRKQLYVENKNLTLEDLISYTDPVIKPKHLYDEILYNYDQETSTSINFEGTLNIHGTQNIGDSINVQIENVNINLFIYKSEDNIYLGGNIGDQTIKSLIYQGSYTSSTLLSTDHIITNAEPPSYLGDYGEENRQIDQSPPEDPSPTSPNQTITFLAQQTFTSPSEVRVVSDVVSGDGYSSTAVGADLSISYRNLEEDPLCHPASESIDPFTFGYCTINEDGEGCDTCDNFSGIEGGNGDSPNFDYEFEMCSYRFKLHGHSFRKIYDGKNAEADPETVVNNDNTDNVGTDLNFSIQNTDGFEEPILTAEPPGEEPILTAEPPGDVNIPVTSSPSTTSDGSTPSTPDTSYGGGSNGCSTIKAIGRGCWVEKCYSFENATYDCKVIVSPSRSTLTRKVFKSSTTTKLDPYKPYACPIPFLNISYNNKVVTVSFPNNRAFQTDQGIVSGSDSGQVCVPLKVNKGCPSIRINQIPDSYLVYESINSSCVDCQDNTDILLNAQSPSYEYFDYVAVCEVGRIIYGDLNGSPEIQIGFRASDGTDDFGRSLPPCYGNVGSLIALCGGGLPWRACQNPVVTKIGSNIQNAEGTNTADDATFVTCDPPKIASRNFRYGSTESYQVWKENLEKQFNKSFLNQQIGNSYSGPLHDTQVRPEIPNADIIEGVIPGSAALKFEEQQITLTKIRPAQEGGIEQGEFTANIVIAYIQYTYRSGKSIASSLIEDALEKASTDQSEGETPPTEEEIIDQFNTVLPDYDETGILIGVKTANALPSCTFLEFPDSYKSLTNSGNSFVSLNPTYLLTSTSISRQACDTNIKCYDSYRDKQTICDPTDWVCWSYAHFANRRAFLNRLYSNAGETWI